MYAPKLSVLWRAHKRYPNASSEMYYLATHTGEITSHAPEGSRLLLEAIRLHGYTTASSLQWLKQPAKCVVSASVTDIKILARPCARCNRICWSHHAAILELLLSLTWNMNTLTHTFKNQITKVVWSKQKQAPLKMHEEIKNTVTGYPTDWDSIALRLPIWRVWRWYVEDKDWFPAYSAFLNCGVVVVANTAVLR